MIIIEGCDLAGKSVLAKRIGSEFRMILRNKTVKGPKETYDYCLHGIEQDTVWDRWCYSEYIYGTFYNRETLTANQIADMEVRAALAKAVVVLLSPPDNILIDRYVRRGETLPLRDVMKIRDRYLKFFSEKWGPLPVMLIDHGDPLSMLQTIQRFHNLRIVGAL